MTRSRFLQSAIGCGMACTMALVFAAGAFGENTSQGQPVQENQKARGEVRFESQPQGSSSQAAGHSSNAATGSGGLRIGELMELDGPPEMFRGTSTPTASSSSLRLGSTIILDSNTTGVVGGFITGDRKAGQGILMRANTGATSAWGMDGITNAIVPIASLSIETWGKVSFFETFNDFAGCTGLPMNVGTLGVLVIDFGTDSNGACDVQEIRQTDLTTGEVRKRDQLNTGPSAYTPVPGGGLVSNSSPIAPIIQLGAGDNGEPLIADNNVRFWILELGQRNEAGDDVIEGPNSLTGFSLCTDPFAAVADDACLAIFGFGDGGGRILFNDGDVAAPLVGNFAGGFYIDNWAGNPDAFECDDGPLGFGGVAFNHVPIALFGAEGPDCDRNGRLDAYDIALDSSIDDGTLDPNCAIADNGIPDVCDCSDCNSNGILDVDDIAMGTSTDCNSNGVPDECELAGNDCNNNGRLDICDIACVDSNGVPIICDGLLGSRDCSRFQTGPNLIPDECDLDPSDPDGDGIVYADCDLNGVVDVCERDAALDCNNNGQEDYCDIRQGLSNDFNDDGIPDECDNQNSHTITFENNHPDGADFSYVLGTVNEQPVVDFTGDFVVTVNDWITGQFNAVGGEINEAGTFDVISGNIGGSGSQLLRVTLPYTVPAIPDEGVTSNALRAVFAVSPVVSFATASGAETWTFAVPKTQEISMDLRFPANQGGSTGELDLDFRGQLTDGGALFSSRVAVRFDTALRADCNNNGIRDLYDIMSGFSQDVDTNGVPDECQTDCNNNDIPDAFEVAEGSAFDVNNNGIPDECELEGNDCNSNGIPDTIEIIQGSAPDLNNNGIIDFCEDCNNNGIADGDDIAMGTSLDQNNNLVPDECELDRNDCNNNGIPDDVDLLLGAPDVNSNGIPDGCDLADCNGNGIEDMCDIPSAVGAITASDPTKTCNQKYGFTKIAKFPDCNGNRAPDVCDLAGNDCNANSIPDDCEIASGAVTDCNNDGIPDTCQALPDCDGDGIPDACSPDCNNNGTADSCDIFLGNSDDCDTNGVPDECDEDCDNNGTPDVCEIDFGPDGIPKNGDEVEDCNDNCILDECEPDCDNNGIPDDCDDITFIPGGSGCNIVNPGAIDTQIVLFTGATVTTTGFDWTENAGQTMNLKVRIELPDVLSTGFLNSIGAVYINDVLIKRFRPSVLQGRALIMDAVAFTWNDNNQDTLGVPGANSFRVDVDNIFISRSQEALDCEEDLLSGDCDGNGICDLFELAAGDANNNGILDVCEGACNDCNHNGIPDDLEIAEGTAVDANSNGVIDDCELTDYSQDWEVDFNTSGLGEQNSLDGQNGWAILQTTGYFGFVRGPNFNSNSFPQSGMDGPNNHFLVVRDFGGGDAAGVIMGPRADSLKEADIELWCWDMFLTSNGFGRYMFEIADICSDGNLATQSILAGIDSIPGNEDQAGEPYIDAINTGLEFRGGNVANNPNRVTILADAGGGKRYDAGSGLDGIAFPSGTLGPQFGEPSFPVRTACIRIKNRAGTVQAMMGNVGVGPPWTNISNFLFLGNRTETTPTGGDKQFIIRHADQSDGATELWFDNLRYIARDDCDLDGVGDDFYLNYMTALPGYNEQDRNNDGILDRCQDCDNDCGGFPITAGQRGCLDPCEINASAPGCGGLGGGSLDCNGNGIPDQCDIAAGGDGNFGSGVPIEIGPQAGLGCLFPGYICKVVRYVGASFDCNQNGIPDECDIANSICDDCNGNGKCDDGEISGAAGLHCGPVDDVNDNDIPDECDGDCNLNGILDPLDIAGLTSQDLQPFISVSNNGDGVPDECCVPPPSSQIGDFDGDGDVDAADYKFLIECEGVVAGAAVTTVTGPTTATCVGCKCACADLFPDGVIDEKDVVIFNRFITGPTP